MNAQAPQVPIPFFLSKTIASLGQVWDTLGASVAVNKCKDFRPFKLKSFTLWKNFQDRFEDYQSQTFVTEYACDTFSTEKAQKKSWMPFP